MNPLNNTDYYADNTKPATYSIWGIAIVLLVAIGLVFFIAGNINTSLLTTSTIISVVVAAGIMGYFMNLFRQKRYVMLRKVADVFFGVILTVFGGMVLNFFIGVLALGSLGNSGLIGALLYGVGVPLLAIFILVRQFRSAGRRFIAYGVLGSAIIPLLIFGACLYSMRGI